MHFSTSSRPVCYSLISFRTVGQSSLFVFYVGGSKVVGYQLFLSKIVCGRAHNNNQMERLNGEIRDREKTMRRLKRVLTQNEVAVILLSRDGRGIRESV
jgi:hypothetical protein